MQSILKDIYHIILVRINGKYKYYNLKYINNYLHILYKKISNQSDSLFIYWL